MKNFIEKLKERWGVRSVWQVAIIFAVFAVTGSSSLKVAQPMLDLAGISKDMNPWIYWPLRILIIFPVYQVLLIIFGTLFGQFQFFWNMEKKMFNRIKSIFVKG